jgi:hypothetical protein
MRSWVIAQQKQAGRGERRWPTRSSMRRWTATSALEGNVVALIFMAKVHLGWQEGHMPLAALNVNVGVNVAGGLVDEDEEREAALERQRALFKLARGAVETTAEPVASSNGYEPPEDESNDP